MALDATSLAMLKSISTYPSRALVLATAAHAGQVDKGGLPYIQHPARVGDYFTDGDWECRSVGYLHDVVEDTDVTLDDLKAAGFPLSVVAAVDAISRRKGEKDLPYLARIIANPIASRVKISDATDNSDPYRLDEIVDADLRDRLREKYTSILTILRAAS